MSRGYQIIDEPAPSRLSHLATDPFWILLATLLGGVWLGWPWFVLNSLAVGSMHRVREISSILVGLAGSLTLVALGGVAATHGTLDAQSLPYAMTVLIVWKLALSYLVMLWQAPSFELSVHFGGVARNGAILAFVGLFFRGQIAAALPGYWGWVFL